MSYNKKYKIMDVMINKQLKGDEVVLKCVSNGDGNKNPNPPRNAPKWFAEFVETQFKPLANLLNKVIKVNNLKTE
jgi:hypothetical protein